MRSIGILAACAAITVGTLPIVVHAQTTREEAEAQVGTWEQKRSKDM